MTQLKEIFQCSVCGNVVEVVNASAGVLTCCDQPMLKLEAKTQDAGNEKHVPVIEKNKEKNCIIKVKVGSIEHPMEDKHYIKFIEVITKNEVLRTELAPGQKPKAEFCVAEADIVQVREFCTVHGLWKNVN
ncbi:MAG: desulfoferrodoxin [Candidatus Omnitrophota bacterium]